MSLMLEQQRAKFAWEKVKASPGKDFISIAKGAPALIMGNGLLASLAFWNSRDTAQGHQLVTALLGWLKERGLITSVEFNAAMNEMLEFDSNKYMRATNETLDFLKWLRQLAAAQG